jgi:hypothetical protein
MELRRLEGNWLIAFLADAFPVDVGSSFVRRGSVPTPSRVTLQAVERDIGNRLVTEARGGSQGRDELVH